MPKKVKFKTLNKFKLSFNIILIQILFNFFVNVCCDNTTETTDRFHVTTTTVDTNSNNNNEKSSLDFKCPEKFGYYPDNKDCSKYYVCVFGDALHESCTGGLYFSAELQTCDWPRNVECALDLIDDRNRYRVDGVNDAFSEDIRHNIHSDNDPLFDIDYNNNNKNNKEKNENINDFINNDSNSKRIEPNEDRDDEEQDSDEEEEEDELTRDELDATSDDYSDNNKSNNNTKIDLLFDNNYGNIFDDDFEDQNSNYSRAQNTYRYKNRDITDGEVIFNREVMGRSADGFNRYELRDNKEKVKDIHGNKVNIEVDPQQPSYDEAISSVVDEMGGIHIHDGPGGVYALPDKNQMQLQEQIVSFNDKDFGFIERIAADRRPIVRVTRVRKRVRTDSEDLFDDITDQKRSYIPEKNIKNQYIPVIVMDKEDMDSDKEEKIRRYRSDTHFKTSESEEKPSTQHFENQKRQQKQYFEEQKRPKISMNSAIPIAIPSPEFNKTLQLRGFISTRNEAGKVMAIPIFKDMINVDSTQNNRRKRVRVVHKIINKPEGITGIVSTPLLMETHSVLIRPNKSDRLIAPPAITRSRPLPRILVPDKNEWQPYLPFYGPSMSQVKKIQLLPPLGPIPVLKEEKKQDLMSVFRPKPKPKLTHYLLENNENIHNTFNVFEKRIKTEATTRPAVGSNQKPKQMNKRLKSKQKSNRNQNSNNRTNTTKEPLKPSFETTTPLFIEVNLNSSSQSRAQNKNSEHVRMKLTRNGKRLGLRENTTTHTTTTPSPDRSSTLINTRKSERLVLNTGAEPLNSFDYFDLPYFEKTSNQTITYVREELIPITTPLPVEHKKPKQTPNKRKQRPKKGSSAPPSRPAPLYPTPEVLSPAMKCTSSKCRLPDCLCGGTQIPNNLSPEETPQMVLITFDDSVNDLNWEIYEEVFSGRHNPNGCPILGTFYVSHEWTDYGQVQTLYSYGHEMASHSITHSFGEKFSVNKWNKEVNGQREILHLYGGVNLADVRGMRAPFLQGGGNKQFEMLYESNFTYDSTMPVFENSPPFWPYTLDYAINHECMIAPCPTKSFPGVWEVGMVMWHDLKGGRCSMGDACSNPSDEEGIHKMLMKNFNRHYLSNRAPFGLYYHSAWFNTPHHRKGFMSFIDEILNNKNVYFVTKYQMIQWVRNPTPLSRIESFNAWNCNYEDRPPPCSNPTVCNVGSKSGSRFLKTCQTCPTAYPWVGNTGFTPTNV